MHQAEKNGSEASHYPKIGMMSLVDAGLTQYLVAAVCIFLVWLSVCRFSHAPRYPRGPLQLPFIGNVFHVLWHGDVIEFLMNCWRKYGDVYTVRVGCKTMVVINGYETIREALVNKAKSFSEHNGFHDYFKCGENSKGLMFSPYPIWKKHRQLLLKALREKCFERQSLYEKVALEAEKVIAEIRNNTHKPFCIKYTLQKAVANIISAVAFGTRFEYDDPQYESLLKINESLFTKSQKMAMMELFPCLSYLPFDLFGLRDMVKMANDLTAAVKSKIAEQEQMPEAERPSSIIGTYLTEIKTSANDGSSEHPLSACFTKDRCIVTICELFASGSETSATALNWALLMCILHPDMQRKIHDEIDQYIGISRLPTISDRQSTAYIDAFLTEVLRFANVVPLAIPHRVINDVMLSGRFIPKDTEIIVNLHSVLHDEKKFETPSAFSPTRFLKSKPEVTYSENVIPFGIGRRTCVGKELAQMELYVLFASIMQHFSFVAPPGATLSEKGILAITRTPIPFKVIALPRSSPSHNNHNSREKDRNMK